MKKRFIALLTAVVVSVAAPLAMAYPLPHAFPPFRIADNFYYVGTDDLASYLIVTPKGNILINPNLEATVPMIRASIEKLGFKYRDTKMVLISHAHLDHAAGSAKVKQETGARYWVMDADVASVASGGHQDFHYSHDATMYYPPTKVDHVLHDGDQVTLGDAVLTAHLTPGHTPGCTTWTFDVKDQGKVRHVVIVGSPYVNPGYRLVNNTNYPDIAADYEKTMQVLKALPCDIFLGSHAMYFNLAEKYARLKTAKENPFVDPVSYQQFVDEKTEAFHAELLKQVQNRS